MYVAKREEHLTLANNYWNEPQILEVKLSRAFSRSFSFGAFNHVLYRKCIIDVWRVNDHNWNFCPSWECSVFVDYVVWYSYIAITKYILKNGCENEWKALNGFISIVFFNVSANR